MYLRRGGASLAAARMGHGRGRLQLLHHKKQEATYCQQSSTCMQHRHFLFWLDISSMQSMHNSPA